MFPRSWSLKATSFALGTGVETPRASICFPAIPSANSGIQSGTGTGTDATSQILAVRSCEAVITRWIRLPEGRVVDGLVAAAITDAVIPAVFGRVEEQIIVPTVDLTIHFRSSLPLAGAKPDDYVLADFRTNVVAEGFLEEDGQIWSRDGVLLAQSRQLAAILPMRG